MTWSEGSFFDNLDKFANSLGFDNSGIAITLAQIPWENTADRDSFIRALTEKDPIGGENYFVGNKGKGGSK